MKECHFTYLMHQNFSYNNTYLRKFSGYLLIYFIKLLHNITIVFWETFEFILSLMLLFILLLMCCVYDAPISKAVLCVIKCVKPNHLLLPALLVYSCNCCDAYIMRPQDVHFFLCCHRIYAILNLLSLLLVWCSFKNS